MILPKINLHIHSIYSDGRNNIQTITEKALKLEFNFIAITDHFSNTWKSGVIKTLDSSKKINLYLEEIETQNNYLIGKNVNLKLLKGIEIDLGSSYNYIEKLINPNSFDLILLEYLEDSESIGFINNLIRSWKNRIQNDNQFPILGLAHFDPSHFAYKNTQTLFNFMESNQIYFEFNSAYSSYYSKKYQELFFDKLKEFDIPVGIGSDSHNINELKFIKEPLEMIKYYGLEKNFNLLIANLNEFKSQ
ncbi:MAG: PHP domain-containing protein [Promethearchaeota archaeon]|nr:MAG: PHP domain-containing protein [Candidatus Lokiarchaeota archaeon]